MPLMDKWHINIVANMEKCLLKRIHKMNIVFFYAPSFVINLIVYPLCFPVMKWVSLNMQGDPGKAGEAGSPGSAGQRVSPGLQL